MEYIAEYLVVIDRKYLGIYSGIVLEDIVEHDTSIVVCILEGNMVGMSGPIANTYVFAR